MPKFKITRQGSNPNFACLVRAELATMCFVSESVANTVETVNYYKCSRKILQPLSGLKSLREKKDVVSHEYLLTINGIKYSTFEEAARAAALSKKKPRALKCWTMQLQ
ncbi:hypothetical protein TNCV_22031 [Trichonephila clavipes]|nr:hypothetical protein TNCV_22031 [Trichonephila clavipes]